MAAVHELKSWPEFFEPLLSGEKTAELRYNDRDYQVGDVLVLQEWEPNTLSYSGRQCRRRVSHVLCSAGHVGAIMPLKGLHVKYVILSLKEDTA